jgi:hypothetical protein
MRQPREPNFFQNTGHLAQPIQGDAIGFAELDANRIQREHRIFGEPAAPSGVGGFVWISDNLFAFATAARVKRQISDVKAIRLFTFYGNNAVVAFGASETTEPM